jgi:carbamoyltransferase
MPQLILGVHSGSHDAAAAVFEDYSLKAAVHLERLTRRKSDGSRHPDAAIDEVLSIAGATRRDIECRHLQPQHVPRPLFPSFAWRGMAARAVPHLSAPAATALADA